MSGHIRIGAIKTPQEFEFKLATLGLRIPFEETIDTGALAPLGQSLSLVSINGKTPGNRFAIHPMEGWDGTLDGKPTADTERRWTRFGESGAKIIFGGEAMAIVSEGRANPNQLILSEENLESIGKLRELLVRTHQLHFGGSQDLLVGFQLTHSGRFCRPNDKKQLEPRIAYSHPILDTKFGVDAEKALLSDEDVEKVIQDFVRGAKLAQQAGADFVDIKHCHGYLLHEFLSARTRSGKYGGSFENRTRILREIIAGIRASGNLIGLAVRLSAFDFVPFSADPSQSSPGKPGPGKPEPHDHLLPYKFAFGCNPQNPLEIDLTETHQFVELCMGLGVKMLNLSAGSPYYNPHIQRPASFPPCDGYRPPNDPLIDVVRQLEVTRQIKQKAGSRIAVIGSAFSYLQELLPNVAQALIRQGWMDAAGLGRMILSYPTLPADVLTHGKLQTKKICRTFSDCTTAPRNGLISGCYPLDPYYLAKPEAAVLKEIKRGNS